MHTSKVLRASDFRYVPRGPEGGAGQDALYPDYQISDRIGVVSPCLEDGLLHTGYALLALTTSFYDCLRSRTADFFDYPQHFAFVGTTADGLATYGMPAAADDGLLEVTWGNLDVWPASQWLFAPATATAMIKQVFDFQINRLFWPQNLLPEPGEGRLPVYLRRMLGARLKSVYYYKTVDPNMEIEVTQPVEDIVRSSLAQLPRTAGARADEIGQREAERYAANGHVYRERYRQTTVHEFLACLDACFEDG